MWSSETHVDAATGSSTRWQNHKRSGGECCLQFAVATATVVEVAPVGKTATCMMPPRCNLQSVTLQNVEMTSVDDQCLSPIASVQELASTMLRRLTVALHASYGQRPGCMPTLSAMAAAVQCKADNGGYGPCISLGRGRCRCKDAGTVDMLLSTQTSAEMKLWYAHRLFYALRCCDAVWCDLVNHCVLATHAVVWSCG